MTEHTVLAERKDENMKLEDLLKDNPEALQAIQVAIDKANEGQEDKLKHVRFADLSEGDYVAKAKFDDLAAQLTGKGTELQQAQDLIEQLKKGTKGDETLQGKIKDYETQVNELQAQLAETKVKSALKVALLSENAVDVDYLTYKLTEKMKESGEQLQLDDNDNIKGWDDKLSSLKTQFPRMFEAQGKTSELKIEPKKLEPTATEIDGLTRADLLKKPYAERAKIFQENPEAFKKAMEG